MKRLRRTVGSLLDGLAGAGANFLGGVIAIRSLPEAELAIYALMTTGAFLIGLLMQQALLSPHRAYAIRLAVVSRTSMPRDIGILLAASPLVLIGVAASSLALVSGVRPEEYLALSISSALWTVLFTLLAHLRSAAHMVGRPGAAASSALVAFLIMAAALVVALGSSTTTLPAAFPFLALATSAGVGSLVCWFLVRTVPVARTRERLTFRIMTGHSGAALIAESTNFIIMVIAASTLTISVLADLEAARLAASPILILLNSLGTAFLPAAIRQYHRGEERPLRKTRRALTLTGIGVAIFGPIGLYLGSPALSELLGRPMVPMLAASRGASNGLAGTSAYSLSIQIALGRFRDSMWHSLMAGIASVVAMILLVSHLGAYAVPASLGLGFIVRILLSRRTVL